MIYNFNYYKIRNLYLHNIGILLTLFHKKDLDIKLCMLQGLKAFKCNFLRNMEIIKVDLKHFNLFLI